MTLKKNHQDGSKETKQCFVHCQNVQGGKDNSAVQQQRYNDFKREKLEVIRKLHLPLGRTSGTVTVIV